MSAWKVTQAESDVVHLEPITSDEKIKAYMLAAVDLLPKGKDKVLDALDRIEADAKPSKNVLALQLLAARNYCRKGRDKRVDLEAIWSWTDEEVPIYVKQEPSKTLYAEAAKAQAAFTKKNPGYKLKTTPIRSLEKQVKLWGDTKSVDLAGAKLLKWARTFLTDYPDEPDDDAERFANKLCTEPVQPEPTRAAPGLSDHGRGMAVDFQVIQDGKKEPIADISTAQIEEIWHGEGWLDKLKEACSETRLKGPLATPYEPWHWCLG
jgi:hypothetical protein